VPVPSTFAIPTAGDTARSSRGTRVPLSFCEDRAAGARTQPPRETRPGIATIHRRVFSSCTGTTQHTVIHNARPSALPDIGTPRSAIALGRATPFAR